MNNQTLENHESVDSFSYECQKQTRLKEQFENDGLALAEDPALLYGLIGTVQELECFCELYTPRLLVKVFVSGTEQLDHSFHLLSLWQIIKFGYLIPQPGEYFTTKYVVGVRKVSENSFVPSLRLPLN
jgi:hypothetical protein